LPFFKESRRRPYYQTFPAVAAQKPFPSPPARKCRMTAPERYRPDNFIVRPAVPTDMPVILSLIRGLAAYESLECDAAPERLEYWLFEKKSAEAVIGEVGGDPVGFALFFTSFSTFVGKPGLYLEDLFVIPKARGNGFGKRMLQYLARLVVERGYGRLEWACLDWNKPSIAFYLSLGAVPLDEWTAYRLAGDALGNLALGDPAPERNLRGPAGGSA
jgi:GNAT superfamily N-acetyltransferase